jgi:hypothetical protein
MAAVGAEVIECLGSNRLQKKAGRMNLRPGLYAQRCLFATALVRLRHLRAGFGVAPLARCVALHAVRGDQRAAPLGVCGV